MTLTSFSAFVKSINMVMSCMSMYCSNKRQFIRHILVQEPNIHCITRN